MTNLLLDIGLDNSSNKDDNDLDCCLAGGDSQSQTSVIDQSRDEDGQNGAEIQLRTGEKSKKL